MISVLMSVYNEKDVYLEQSINSIINQTYSNFEFIIVVDKPDNFKAIELLKKYQVIDSRIKILFNKENIGLTRSLNRALANASGEYIARMDADDISNVDRFQKQMKFLENNQLDLIGSLITCIDENGSHIEGEDTRYYSPKVIMDTLRVHNCVPHPTWFAKKIVFEKLNEYREIESCEDYDFLLRALKEGFKIGICDCCLLKYRINTTGISRSNAFRQRLVNQYISKNFYRIEHIESKEISQYLCKMDDIHKKEKYMKAEEYYNLAMKYRNKNKMKMIGYIFVSYFYSKYFRRRYHVMIRVRFIRIINNILVWS